MNKFDYCFYFTAYKYHELLSTIIAFIVEKLGKNYIRRLEAMSFCAEKLVKENNE